MSETIEFDLSVSKINEAKGEDLVLTATLAGEKAVVVESISPGFEVIDVLEMKLTVKCGAPQTLKHLGIEKYMNRKVLVMRDRDASLECFEPVPVAAEQREIT